jgi:hypothetical protein
MKELSRIKQLFESVESEDFTLKEQKEQFLDNVWDLGSDAIGGLWNTAKDAVNNGIPVLVDKVSGDKIMTQTPFSGNLEKVVSSAAKLFKTSINGSVVSKTDTYNALIIIDNLIQGTNSNLIVDKKGQDFSLWEVLESFTVALYYEFRGESFDYEKMWSEIIEEDDIDDACDSVIDRINSSLKYESTFGPVGEEIKEFLLELFESGKSFTMFYNDDRLDGDWQVGKVRELITKIDMSSYDANKLQSEFETKLSTDLPCYESAKLQFVKVGNSEKVNAAVKVEDKWTTILYYKGGKLVANVYYGGTNKPPVAITADIDCEGGSIESGQNINAVGINESLLLEQETNSKYVRYGSLRLGFDPQTFEELRVLHNGGKVTQTTEPETTTQTTEPETTTQTTQTTEPETKQNDSGEDSKETEVVKTNIQKLIELLVSKGVSPVFANDQKYRADMGAVSVGALLGKTITVDEYIKSEEDVYAEKFIESINKKITTFNKNETNHEKEEKMEERVIDTTVKISNPTPLELAKIEEVGDDAVAKTNNELSFDKNRIKTVRITSNENKVVYVAKDNITDLVSDIESQLERIFGGDWMLDKAKNKFMSSNKLFIFSKKEK